MLAYVFPGQGSQHKGMGAELFDEFKDLTLKTDRILSYSIKELCMEDKDGNLGQTQYTQPALYVVNAMTYYKKSKETGETPDFVAGHSLGEYNALLAAGVINFETGLKIVKYRGELMSRASNGGMAAVIGIGVDEVKEVLRENRFDSIDIANINAPSQIVISGPKDDIERAQSAFEAAGAKKYVVLKVSGAFHSRYMENAKKHFKEFIDQFEFSYPVIPVISNVKARPYKKSEIKLNMTEQITGSVMWNDTIRYMMGKGDVEIIQIGPGNAISGLVRSIKREAEPLIVDDSDINDSFVCTEDISIECTLKADEPLPEKSVCSCTDIEGFSGLTAGTLGSEEFKRDYNLKYAYLTGGMYRGIASKEMVVRVGKIGVMGFLGCGGLSIAEIREGIEYIQRSLPEDQPYGINLVYNITNPHMEEDTVELFIQYGIKNVEASAYMNITPAIVRYRLNGLKRGEDGHVISTNRIIAKVSRPEVAEIFMSPVNESIIKSLLSEGKITPEEADMAKDIPVANDICVEADSGGHTNQGTAYALVPSIMKLRDEMMNRYGYHKRIHVGAAGGIGTPEAAAAAFILGADFILTGSINQCTVEAATSSTVKDLLQKMNVQDTEYAPAGDMFEMGAKVQVLKKGLFFPARAKKLYDLYRLHDSLEEIDDKTKKQIQENYFKRSFSEVYNEVKEYLPSHEIERIESSPKYKMASIFRWYFGYSSRIAIKGDEENKVDYQVHCGPALGSFNQWVKGTALESWENRHVDEIGMKLMNETAELLNGRFREMFSINK